MRYFSLFLLFVMFFSVKADLEEKIVILPCDNCGEYKFAAIKSEDFRRDSRIYTLESGENSYFGKCKILKEFIEVDSELVGKELPISVLEEGETFLDSISEGRKGGGKIIPKMYEKIIGLYAKNENKRLEIKKIPNTKPIKRYINILFIVWLIAFLAGKDFYQKKGEIINRGTTNLIISVITLTLIFIFILLLLVDIATLVQLKSLILIVVLGIILVFCIIQSDVIAFLFCLVGCVLLVGLFLSFFSQAALLATTIPSVVFYFLGRRLSKKLP